jgi:hypothetical protein
MCGFFLYGSLFRFKSPLMYLTGSSLEIYIFHHVVFLLTHNCGVQLPIFTYLGSLERSRSVDGSWRIFGPGLGL